MNRVEYIAGNREVIFSSLAGLGIEMVLIQYDGSGDDGQIEPPVAYSQGAEAISSKLSEKIIFAKVHVAYGRSEAGIFVSEETVIEEELALRDGIEEFCWALLEQKCGGWEIDDGACGEFTFDVARRSVAWVHNARYTETSEIEV